MLSGEELTSLGTALRIHISQGPQPEWLGMEEWKSHSSSPALSHDRIIPDIGVLSATPEGVAAILNLGSRIFWWVTGISKMLVFWI